MLGDGGLAFEEFVRQEPLPLATVHRAILEFFRDLEDAFLFGAQAVNAYVDEPRMTQDVDVLSTRAGAIAEELRDRLNVRFHIAVRLREISEGRGFRLDQIQKLKNRHLVYVRAVAILPPAQRIGGILVVMPEELIAGMLIAFHRRRGTPKSGTDWRDLAVLLLTFPELKANLGWSASDWKPPAPSPRQSRRGNSSLPNQSKPNGMKTSSIEVPLATLAASSPRNFASLP